LLTLPTALAAAAALMALAALLRARRVSRRLERLVETYWELRYEYGQLRARVARLEGQPESESTPGAPAGTSAFVPLSSVKR
jgi:hypothetical protein